ncbi:hypothetical protein ABZ860_13695 [Microbispora sp. NPDC046973]|uniref:hypothetical protein n=1 Tax=Microbispora sp. NPDC046973 TaxID=3155022 RepID=UPI0033F787D7
MVELAARVGDLRMPAGTLLPGLGPVVRPFALAGQRPLEPREFLLRPPQESGGGIQVRERLLPSLPTSSANRPNTLWSRASFAASVGGEPVNVLRQYNEQRNRPPVSSPDSTLHPA